MSEGPCGLLVAADLKEAMEPDPLSAVLGASIRLAGRRQHSVEVDTGASGSPTFLVRPAKHRERAVTLGGTCAAFLTFTASLI